MSRYAPSLYRALNGVFCIYKPTGLTIQQTMHAIKVNLTREMVGYECRPVRNRVVLDRPSRLISTDIDDVHRESQLGAETTPDNTTETAHQRNDTRDEQGGVESSPSDGVMIRLDPDYSDHPLVVGPRYTYDDFQLKSVGHLGKQSSGVLVLGVGRGLSMVKRIAFAQYLRVYHVRGELGKATQDFTPLGKLIERTTYHHVTQPRLDRVVAAMQAGHQRHMYQSAGVDVQSQAAYELACRGLIRPTDKEAGPVIYSVKCIEFDLPYFNLEIHAINETCLYLMKLIHEIGLELKSSAVCLSVRRVRYGYYTLDHAMLLKHCYAQSIVDNIQYCAQLLNDRRVTKRPHRLINSSHSINQSLA